MMVNLQGTKCVRDASPRLRLALSVSNPRGTQWAVRRYAGAGDNIQSRDRPANVLLGARFPVAVPNAENTTTSPVQALPRTARPFLRVAFMWGTKQLVAVPTMVRIGAHVDVARHSRTNWRRAKDCYRTAGRRYPGRATGDDRFPALSNFHEQGRLPGDPVSDLSQRRWGCLAVAVLAESKTRIGVVCDARHVQAIICRVEHDA